MPADGALHLLFLRAINTGARRLTNDELLAPFVEAGYEDVAAYQAAGNIAFRVADATPDVEQLERRLASAYGFDTPIFLRTEAAVRSVIDRCPFTSAELAAAAGKPQVTLLRSPASSDQVAEVAAITPADDRVAFDGREWYWLPVEGVSTSSLPVPQIERIVGPMTMRTLGTLERMLKKFS